MPPKKKPKTEEGQMLLTEMLSRANVNGSSVDGKLESSPAAQNLRQRVEGCVARFLSSQKWSPNLNKNQLRDALRKHINQSGMLAQGVERIIEQVVNPKILQVIKPKIDEVVCKQLGVDYREWQTEIARRKTEAIRQHQLQQQQKIQAVINNLQQQAQQQVSSSTRATSISGMPENFSVPPPGMFPSQEPHWQMFGGLFPQTPFGSPFTFTSVNQQTFPGNMQGWGLCGSAASAFSPQQQPPQQQQTPPALPLLTQPATVQPSPLITPSAFPVSGSQMPLPATPVHPIAPPPPASIIPPPSVPTAPPPVPDLSKPPPETDSSSAVPLVTSSLNYSKPPPVYGLSSSVPGDPPPPGTEMALHGISLPLSASSTSPTSAAKLDAATSIHSFLSPRLLAEAMIESPQPKYGKKGKKEFHAKEEQTDSKDRVEIEYVTEHVDSSQPARSLFLTTARMENHAAAVTDMEASKPHRLKMDDEWMCDSSFNQEKVVNAEKDAGRESQRQYRFAWNEEEDGELSDVTISSVHTSDLSSLQDSSESSDERDLPDTEEALKDDSSLPRPEMPADMRSKNEETANKRMAVNTDEEVEVRKEEHDEVKDKLQTLEPEDTSGRIGKNLGDVMEKGAVRASSSVRISPSGGGVTQEAGASTDKSLTPRKKRRTKAEMKEELMQQKVEQRRAMRRQRTLNRRYASEEFTSIFSENRALAPNLGLSAPNTQVVEDNLVTDWATVEIDNSSVVEQEVEVQEECVLEVETEADTAVEASSKAVSAQSGDKLDTVSSQTSSPYSDISTSESVSRSSLSEKSPPGQYQSAEDIIWAHAPPVKKSRRIQQQEEQTFPKSPRSRGLEATESRTRASQRYSMDDLYKPRTSHRRTGQRDTERGRQGRSDIQPDQRTEGSSYSLDRDMKDEQHQSGPLSRSKPAASKYSGHSTRSNTVRGATSPAFAGQADCGEREIATVTHSAIADMELEPVSPEDNSLDHTEEEDEAKSPLSYNGTVESWGSKREGHHKLEAAEVSSGEGDSDMSEAENRQKSRIPVELVDFGEAAWHSRGSGTSCQPEESRSSRWQDMRGYSSKHGLATVPSPSASGHEHAHNCSRMVWEASACSTSSFRKESERVCAIQQNPSPPWDDSHSSPERESNHNDSSVELHTSVPQRDLYSPINDSSSSVNSDSVTTSPPKRRKRARQTSSSSSSVSSSYSSSASSSSSSSCLAPDSRTAQPLKRRRKDLDLSDGEIASGSSEERYRYENLPKAVRKYQVPSSRERSSLSSRTSDGSTHIRRHRTRLSASVASEGQRSLSSSQCSQHKQGHPSSPHDRPPHKRRRTRCKRSGSPEVRKIMLQARDKQQPSDEENQGDGQLSRRQKSRSYLHADLSASSVSSKSFSDDQPSPSPPQVHAPPPPQLLADRPCTPSTVGDQDEGTAGMSEDRKPFSVSSLLLRGTSPVSDGEFEQLDKDGEMSMSEGLLSSPEEGQRSPSPLPPRIEDLPLDRTPARSTVSSPPQLQPQSVSVERGRQLTLSLDGTSPEAECHLLLAHQAENEGSPYPPPPVLSAERSPLPMCSDKEGASPVPPLLEPQAIDSQVSKSSHSDGPLPPLPGSPYPPAPPRSPASDRPDTLQGKNSSSYVAEPAAETGALQVKESSGYVSEPAADTEQPAAQMLVNAKCYAQLPSPSLSSLQPPSPPRPEIDRECVSLSSSQPLTVPVLPQVSPSAPLDSKRLLSSAAEEAISSLDACASASRTCAELSVPLCNVAALGTTDCTQSCPTFTSPTVSTAATLVVSEPFKRPSPHQACNNTASSQTEHSQSQALPEYTGPAVCEQSHEHSVQGESHVLPALVSPSPGHLSPKPVSPGSGCPSHQPAFAHPCLEPVKATSPFRDQSAERSTSPSPSQQSGSCLTRDSLGASTNLDQHSDKSVSSAEAQQSTGSTCPTWSGLSTNLDQS